MNMLFCVDVLAARRNQTTPSFVLNNYFPALPVPIYRGLPEPSRLRKYTKTKTHLFGHFCSCLLKSGWPLLCFRCDIWTPVGSTLFRAPTPRATAEN